ncbi:hypothetical protein ACFVZM_14155 [Streptomyces sioyaensis]|uniref:hypothetical protein n=1 Tax=Streptomyces sioyaensis TaxID=67364 RepID=UPI0036991D92
MPTSRRAASRSGASPPASRRRLITFVLSAALLALVVCASNAHGAHAPRVAQQAATVQQQVASVQLEQPSETAEPVASAEPTGHLCTQPALGRAAVGVGRAIPSGLSLAVCVPALAACSAQLAAAGRGPRGPCIHQTGRTRLAVACCWRI